MILRTLFTLAATIGIIGCACGLWIFVSAVLMLRPPEGVDMDEPPNHDKTLDFP